MNKISEIDIAYLAGLFDGEGHAGIIRYKNKIITSHEFYFRARASLSNTNIGLLKWIKDITGIGGVYIYQGSNSSWKPNGKWMIASSDAVDFLSVIRPYLKVKAEIVDVVLGFRNGVCGRLRTEEEYSAQNELYYKTRELNRRGVIIAN